MASSSTLQQLTTLRAMPVTVVRFVYVVCEKDVEAIAEAIQACLPLSLLSLRLSVGATRAICVVPIEWADKVPAVDVDVWAVQADVMGSHAALCDMVRSREPDAAAAVFLDPRTVVTHDVASVALDLLEDTTLPPGMVVVPLGGVSDDGNVRLPFLARLCVCLQGDAEVVVLQSPVSHEAFVASLIKTGMTSVGLRSGCGLHVGASCANDMALAMLSAEALMRRDRMQQTKNADADIFKIPASAFDDGAMERHRVAFYSVHLSRRPERAAKVAEASAALEAQVRRRGHYSNIRIVEAVDGAAELDQRRMHELVDSGFLTTCAPLPLDEFTRVPLRVSNVAAFLSHRLALARFVAEGAAYAVILEDDVSLRPRFYEAVERVVRTLDTKWAAADVVQLHVMPSQRLEFVRTWDPECCGTWRLASSPTGTWGMQAYLVTRMGAEALLRPGGLWPMRGAVDEQLSRVSAPIRLRALVGCPTVVDEDTRAAPSVTNFSLPGWGPLPGPTPEAKP
jgi:GR25 family glycosyltransferase involved in LPS biosynthesis